jgi:hypothetical protein
VSAGPISIFMPWRRATVPARRYALQNPARPREHITSRLIASRSRSRCLIERSKNSASAAAPAKTLASAAASSRRKPFMINPSISGARAIPIGARVRGLDRLDAEGPFDGGQGQAGWHHSGWRRGLAQRVGGWRHLHHPTCSTRRTRIALDRRPSQTQTAKAGRRGVGQQNGPHRLEADDHRRKLRCEIRAGHSGERGLEISQTRGATQLQPC